MKMITQCSISSTRVFRSRFMLVCVCMMIEHLDVCPVIHLQLHPEQGTYPLLFYISPWRRILEKLMVPQLVKFATFYGTPKFHYLFHRSPPLVPVLSQMNPATPFQSTSWNTHFHIFLSSTPGFSKWFLFFQFSLPKLWVHLCSPPHALYDALISSPKNWPQ